MANEMAAALIPISSVSTPGRIRPDGDRRRGAGGGRGRWRDRGHESLKVDYGAHTNKDACGPAYRGRLGIYQRYRFRFQAADALERVFFVGRTKPNRCRDQSFPASHTRAPDGFARPARDARLQFRKSGLRPGVAGARAKTSSVHRRISVASSAKSGSEGEAGGASSKPSSSTGAVAGGDSLERFVMWQDSKLRRRAVYARNGASLDAFRPAIRPKAKHSPTFPPAL
jgi:hypothetical protein